MRIDFPAPEEICGLRTLWQASFGDDDAFLDIFFASAFSPRRCRRVTVDGRLAAMLYWFDISCRDQKMAYLYAVATDPEFRGRGLCRELMEDTHRLLTAEGYAGAVLVPDGEDLSRMYEKMGYRFCAPVAEFTCAAGGAPVPIRTVSREEYARLRRQLLPAGGVVQEGENLAFLEKLTGLYAGTGFLLAARTEGNTLIGAELLGDPGAAPGILNALGLDRGRFRGPGDEKPFAMFLPLREDAEAPAYFGLAFD